MNKLNKFVREQLNILMKYYAYERLYELIDAYNIQNYAEIGVWKGNTLAQISKHPKIKKAYGIDPWKEYDNYGKSEAKKFLDQKQMEHVYNEVTTRFKHNPKITILRKTSLQASKELSNIGLDLVFIDANHTYEHVKQDILAWLPNIKPGGILAGHDYTLQFFGVTQAVNEVLGEENVSVCKKGTGVWWYQKPSNGHILELMPEVFDKEYENSLKKQKRKVKKNESMGS